MSEILEHATRLFAERGYDGTTLQDIADAIGITRPGLYNYISSKEQLLAALNWVAWWFHPGSSHPAEPVADQLAQNAVDMLSYPQGTGSLTTAPHRALQMVRENLDYLERFLGPDSVHDPGSTQPS